MKVGDYPSSITLTNPTVNTGQNFGLDVTLGSALPNGDYAVRAFVSNNGVSSYGPNANGELPAFPVTLSMQSGQTQQVPLNDTVTNNAGRFVFDLVRSADVGNYGPGVELCSSAAETVTAD